MTGIHEDVYEINFKDRAEFERVWPVILKLKSNGGHLILKRAPSRWAKLESGIQIFCPPHGLKPAPKALETHAANSSRPPEYTDDGGDLFRSRIDIALVVDGKTIDLNRIPLPPDTPIVDRRWNEARRSATPDGALGRPAAESQSAAKDAAQATADHMTVIHLAPGSRVGDATKITGLCGPLVPKASALKVLATAPELVKNEPFQSSEAGRYDYTLSVEGTHGLKLKMLLVTGTAKGGTPERSSRTITVPFTTAFSASKCLVWLDTLPKGQSGKDGDNYRAVLKRNGVVMTEAEGRLNATGPSSVALHDRKPLPMYNKYKLSVSGTDGVRLEMLLVTSPAKDVAQQRHAKTITVPFTQFFCAGECYAWFDTLPKGQSGKAGDQYRVILNKSGVSIAGCENRLKGTVQSTSGLGDMSISVQEAVPEGRNGEGDVPLSKYQLRHAFQDGQILRGKVCRQKTTGRPGTHDFATTSEVLISVLQGPDPEAQLIRAEWKEIIIRAVMGDQIREVRHVDRPKDSKHPCNHLIGRQFTFQVGAQNKVAMSSRLDEYLELIKDLPLKSGKDEWKESFESFVREPNVYLPNKAVAVGDRWTIRRTMQVIPFGNPLLHSFPGNRADGKVMAELKEVETTKGGRVAHIQLSGCLVGGLEGTPIYELEGTLRLNVDQSRLIEQRVSFTDHQASKARKDPTWRILCELRTTAAPGGEAGGQ